MRRWIFLFGCGLITALPLVIATTGCGSTECTGDTVERDGECVLADDLQCGNDEVLQDGECVPHLDCAPNTERQDSTCVADEPTDCSPNSELDPNENECFVTDDACDGNTAFDSDENRCIPTDQICDDDTHFDDDTGLCYPDVRCRPGDVVDDNGYCVPMGEYLADRADVETQSGAMVDIELEQPGDRVIFEGTINEPAGDLPSTNHVRFEADEGDWFEISIYSLGLPDPMFVVESEGLFDDYERFSAEASGQDKYRQIAVPEQGGYELTVMAGDDTDGELGDQEWDYVAVIEQIDPADAADYDSETGIIRGLFGDLDDNFYVTDEFAGEDRIYLEWARWPGGVEPALQTWRSPTDFDADIDQQGQFVDIPDSGQLYILVDWARAFGLNYGEYELYVHDDVADLTAGDSREVEFHAGRGDIARIGWVHSGYATSQEVDITVTGPDDEQVLSRTTDETEELSLQIEADGDYVAQFDNTSTTTLSDFTPTVDVIRRQQFEQLDVEPGDLVTIRQQNEDDNEVVVEIDDGDHTVMETRLGSGEIAHYHVDDDPETLQLWFADIERSSNLSITADVHSPHQGPQFDLQAHELARLHQYNPGEHDIFVSVQHEDSDQHVFHDWVSYDDIVEFFIGDDSGTHTVSYYDVFAIDDIEVNVDVVGPAPVDQFSADTGARATIEQTNDTGESTAIGVFNDDTGEIAVYGDLDAGTTYFFEVVHGGTHTVYQYDVDIEGVEVTTEITNPVELSSFSVEQDGVVAEVSHDNDHELSIGIVNNDQNRLVDAYDFDSNIAHAMAFVGLESGDHSVIYRDLNELEIDIIGVDIEVDIVVPESIDEIDDTYTGTASENFFGEHSYYIVELDETSVWRLSLKHTGGFGWLTALVYEVGEGFARRMLTDLTPSSPQASMDFEFEADTQYIIRLGHLYAGYHGTTQYELTFNEL